MFGQTLYASHFPLLTFLSLSTVVIQIAFAQNARLLTASQALAQLRPPGTLTVPQIHSVIRNAVHGTSYPALSRIPQTSFSCDEVSGSGFYADPETGCQVFRQCHPDGRMFSYLCPNRTIFNQVALVCDWWYNVDCSKTVSFWEYSNPRIYDHNMLLLDDGGAPGPTRSAATPRPIISVRITSGPAPSPSFRNVGRLHNDQSDFFGIMEDTAQNQTELAEKLVPNKPRDEVEQSHQPQESIVFFTNVTARTIIQQPVTTSKPRTAEAGTTRKPGITRLLYGKMKHRVTGPLRSNVSVMSTNDEPSLLNVTFSPSRSRVPSGNTTLSHRSSVQRHRQPGNTRMQTLSTLLGTKPSPTPVVVTEVPDLQLSTGFLMDPVEADESAETTTVGRIVVGGRFGSRRSLTENPLNQTGRQNLESFVRSLWVA